MSNQCETNMFLFIWNDRSRSRELWIMSSDHCHGWLPLLSVKFALIFLVISLQQRLVASDEHNHVVGILLNFAIHLFAVPSKLF